MKIAITASGHEPTSTVDARFGRAAYFMVYDTTTSTWTAVPNAQNAGAPQGAGVQAAQLLAREKVSVVISGHCGPKAFRALQAGAIEVYSGANGTVAEALEAYQAGKLVRLSAPDVQGHW